MRPAICAALLALASLSNPSEARADTSSRLRSRFYLGLALDAFDATSSLTIDDRSEHDEGGTFNGSLNAAYVQGVLPHFGVGLFGSIGSAATRWSYARNETRTRTELALGPVLVLPAGYPNLEWRVGIPFGYTRTWFKPGEGRAVEETFSTAHGTNLALVTGFDMLGEHHGGFIDLSYVFHLSWLTHTATLRSDESVQAKQSYRYFERALFLGAGYAYRF